MLGLAKYRACNALHTLCKGRLFLSSWRLRTSHCLNAYVEVFIVSSSNTMLTLCSCPPHWPRSIIFTEGIAKLDDEIMGIALLRMPTILLSPQLCHQVLRGRDWKEAFILELRGEEEASCSVALRATILESLVPVSLFRVKNILHNIVAGPFKSLKTSN